MTQIFQVSLPTIPNKCIKYKIQDIKQISFGSQQTRFEDNKKFLTKKFVHSFQNFSQNCSNLTNTTHDTSQKSLSVQNKSQKKIQFRNIIPQNKKFLIPIYSNILKQQRKKRIKNPQQIPQNNNNAYTFKKSGLQYKNPSPYKNLPSPQQNLQINNHPTIQTKKSKYNNIQTLHEHILPSAVFQNQSRNKFHKRFNSLINVPGPGTYFLKNQSNSKKKYQQLRNINQQQNNQLPNYQYLKHIIAQVLQKKQLQQLLSTPQQPIEKQIKQHHMFAQRDSDRFGNQVFPIILKFNTPGPGSYEVNTNMENKIKKIVMVQEQRKLLKQWFNS